MPARSFFTAGLLVTLAAGAAVGAAPPAECLAAAERACPRLLGDACLLCAGRHDPELRAAGCNDTSLEWACHPASPAQRNSQPGSKREMRAETARTGSVSSAAPARRLHRIAAAAGRPCARVFGPVPALMPPRFRGDAGGKPMPAAATHPFHQRTDKVLDHLRDTGQLKSLQTIRGPMGPTVDLEGSGECLRFCSNNYLGLANHPEVVEAGVQALREYGAGTVVVQSTALVDVG